MRSQGNLRSSGGYPAVSYSGHKSILSWFPSSQTFKFYCVRPFELRADFLDPAFQKSVVDRPMAIPAERDKIIQNIFPPVTPELDVVRR